MKIACISTSQVPSLTANSIQVMKTCGALAKINNEVRLWVPGSQPTGWEDLSGHYALDTPFKVSWIPSQPFWRRYDFAWNSLQQARRWGADLVYTWLAHSAVLALWAGLPAVLEVHDMPSGQMGPVLFRLFMLSRAKKRLLVITNALRQKLEKTYAFTLQPPQTLIAPNGSDPERYNNLPGSVEARRLLGLPEGPTAVYSGHFYAGRGIELMLGLAQKLPSVHFLWVGGTPQSVMEWRAQLQTLGLNNVILTGFVENSRLPLYQAAGDVLLMPFENLIRGSSGGNSAEICSPMKMFDYLACGRVIIASDLPVLHEVLNLSNSTFCPIGDLPAWVESLNNLLNDSTRRQKLEQQAREDSTLYTWHTRANKALEGF